MKEKAVEFIPIGGLGEFGMNMMVVRIGDDALIIDCGMLFPSEEHLGVEVIFPNLEALHDLGNLHGIILTHGHEDHIGAVPWLLEHFKLPVFAPPYAGELLKPRLQQRGFRFRDVVIDLNPKGGPCTIGPFKIETFPVSHSMPHCLMLGIQTPEGWIVHSGDFKLDPEPLDGVKTDLSALDSLSKDGVLALLSDSTNAEVPGFTPSESRVGPALAPLIKETDSRVFITTFASNVYRMQQVAEVTQSAGRKLAIVGRSLERHAEISQRFGILQFPAGLRVSSDTVQQWPSNEIVVLLTGSQGEPNSALSRVAVDRHRDISLEEGDRLIHSARRIPGNEKSISRVFNHVIRRGGHCIDARAGLIHVSGHASQEEQRILIRTLNPQHFIPIHGELTQLHAHANLAKACGIREERIHLLRNGDRLKIRGTESSRGPSVPIGHVFMDANTESLPWESIRDRKKMADDGLVIVVLSLGGSQAKRPSPVIHLRGFSEELPGGDFNQRVREHLRNALAQFSREEQEDEAILKSLVQKELKRFFRRHTGKRPLIVPIVVEF